MLLCGGVRSNSGYVVAKLRVDGLDNGPRGNRQVLDNANERNVAVRNRLEQDPNFNLLYKLNEVGSRLSKEVPSGVVMHPSKAEVEEHAASNPGRILSFVNSIERLS